MYYLISGALGHTINLLTEYSHMKIRFTLTLLAGLFIAMSAHATVITFNGTANEGQTSENSVGATYTEAGFTFELLTGVSFFIDNNFNTIPSLQPFDDDVLELDVADTVVSVVSDLTPLFDATSVTVGAPFGGVNIRQLIFTGFLNGGGTAVQTIDILHDTIFVVNLNSGFSDLIRLEISTPDADAFPILDNLTLTAVTTPVIAHVTAPTILPLFGTSLVVMGFIGWRRKHKVSTTA